MQPLTNWDRFWSLVLGFGGWEFGVRSFGLGDMAGAYLVYGKRRDLSEDFTPLCGAEDESYLCGSLAWAEAA